MNITKEKVLSHNHIWFFGSQYKNDFDFSFDQKNLLQILPEITFIYFFQIFGNPWDPLLPL